MNKKLLIPVMLFIPGFLAACGKTPEEEEQAKKAKDLIKEVKINLDFKEGEDSYISASHLQVVLPPTEGDITLSTEIKVDKEKTNRTVAGCAYSLVGEYSESVVTLTDNVLHLKNAVTLTLKTSFTFKDTKETFSKQFAVEFQLPEVQKATLTRGTLGELTNYFTDFTEVNGVPGSVSDEESLCEMSGNGSYGYSTYAKLERISKVTFKFARLGTFSSVEAWGTLYANKGTYTEKTGDVRETSSVGHITEDNEIIIDFAERADDFNDAPYCFQCWFWNSSSLSEESSLIRSITIEYVPYVEAE